MSRDHHRLAGVQLGRSIYHMLQQRLAAQTVQHFGQGTLHARAFASGHDDHIYRPTYH